MKAKLKPKYIAMTQQRYHCIPTCIQMILYRRGFPLIEQEDIGIDLGLIVPPDEIYDFNKAVTGRKPPAGFGTRINLKKYSLNSFFEKRNIPLTSRYHLINDIHYIDLFINNNLERNNDILTCFSFERLYDRGNPEGHCSLIEEINNDKLVLVDPSAILKRRKVVLDDLIHAIEVHKNEKRSLGGFWVIE